MKMQEVVHNGRKFKIPVSFKDAVQNFHTTKDSIHKMKLRKSKLKHI